MFKSDAVFRRCNVHKVHTNLLLLIYVSVMLVQNQNMVTFICRQTLLSTQNMYIYNFSTILICPRNLNLNIRLVPFITDCVEFFSDQLKIVYNQKTAI